jgi:hypothetical protein
MAFRYDDEVFTLLLPGVELVTRVPWPSACASQRLMSRSPATARDAP